MRISVRFFVWKPLTCQTRPVKRVGDNQVVKIWRILFPGRNKKIQFQEDTIKMQEPLHTMFCIPKY